MTITAPTATAARKPAKSHLTLVHHSERWDRPLRTLRRDAAVLRETGDAVFRTEMTSVARGEALRTIGWSYLHDFGPGANEQAFEWSNSALSLSGMPFTTPVTNQFFYRVSGKKAPLLRALVVPMHVASRPGKQLIMVGTHFPVRNTDHRRDVWVSVAKGVVSLVRQQRRRNPEAEVVLSADFNANYRNAASRALIEEHLCKPLKMTAAWDGFVPRNPKVGTYDSGTILDGMLVSEGVEVVNCRVLPDTDGSDHRPFAVDISF